MENGGKQAGIEALRRGDPAAAIEALSYAVTVAPEDAEAFGYLGIAYGQIQESQRAVSCLEEATRLAPESAPLWHNLAGAHEQSGDGDAALAAYRRALAVDPGYLRSREAAARLERILRLAIVADSQDLDRTVIPLDPNTPKSAVPETPVPHAAAASEATSPASEAPVVISGPVVPEPTVLANTFDSDVAMPEPTAATPEAEPAAVPRSGTDRGARTEAAEPSSPPRVADPPVEPAAVTRPATPPPSSAVRLTKPSPDLEPAPILSSPAPLAPPALSAPPAPQTQPARRRRRTTAAILLALGVLLAGGIGWLLVRAGDWLGSRGGPPAPAAAPMNAPSLPPQDGAAGNAPSVPDVGNLPGSSGNLPLSVQPGTREYRSPGSTARPIVREKP